MLKRLLRLIRPPERLSLEEGGMGPRHHIVPCDELVVEPGQAEVALQRSQEPRGRPCLDGLHLGRIHGAAYR